MNYRLMGNTGKKVSALGFGCMRLPILDGDNSKIDKPQAEKMIEYALDNGINYFDTAYVYHSKSFGPGNSESFVGEVLKSYRENVHFATKLPSWLVRQPSDNDKFLDEQLSAMNTDYIDFYLLHSLNMASYENLKKNGIFEFIERAKKSGKVRHIGFSYHDEPENFAKIFNDYDWEFCQIQYNFLDRDFQAGEAGLKLASDKGAGVVIMEPLRGGLITDVVKPAREILKACDAERPMVEWALSWLFNQSSISTVLSGMSTLDQVKQNIDIASRFDEGNLSTDELAAIDKATKIIKDSIKVPCTGCQYCMPCPQGVNIPWNFTKYNDYHYFEKDSAAAKKWIENYPKFTDDAILAKHCIQCGECESHCPQNIKISEMIPKVADLFTPR